MKVLLLLPFLLMQFPDAFVKLTSFQIDFEQKTVSPLFPEIHDSGVLYVDGCKFRFEYNTNEKRITIGDCRNIYQFSEGESQPLVFKWKEIKNNPFLQLLINRSAIREAFAIQKISDEPVVYRMVPRTQEPDSPFTVLKLTLSKDETIPRKIEIIDETQQVITYTFSNFQKGSSLPETLFNPEAVK